MASRKAKLPRQEGLEHPLAEGAPFGQLTLCLSGKVVLQSNVGLQKAYSHG